MSESKFCEQCGSKTYSSAKFCTECGRSFNIHVPVSENLATKSKRFNLGKTNDLILAFASLSLLYSLDVYFGLIPRFLWIVDYQTALSYASYSVFSTIFFWTILFVRLIRRRGSVSVPKQVQLASAKKRAVREL